MQSHTLRFVTGDDDTVIEQPVELGGGIHIGVSPALAALLSAIEVVPAGATVDEFVLEHLDEIVGIAASAVAWRNSMKRPRSEAERLDPHERARSMKVFLEYGTVLDTVSPEVRGWLATKVPKTLIKLMEGG